MKEVTEYLEEEITSLSKYNPSENLNTSPEDESKRRKVDDSTENKSSPSSTENKSSSSSTDLPVEMSSIFGDVD